MKRFSYSRDGQTFGPTDLGGLRQLAKSMHLRPDCTVSEPGKEGGFPATTIEGIRFLKADAPAADETHRSPVIDFAYLASERRLIRRIFLGGTVFLAALFLVAILLGSKI